MPVYSAEQLDEWREAIVAAWQEGLEDPPESWSVSRADLARVVAVFPSLGIRAPYVWRAYQYRARDSGQGLVFAVTEGTVLPTPVPDEGGRVAPPPGALAHLFDSVDGDGSAESYVQNSLLLREMESFGTAGHGTTTWDESEIVDTDPTNIGSDDWLWTEARPEDWRPRVDASGDKVTVVFYATTSFDQQRVVRHRDVYTRGSYRPDRRDEVIAEGGSGYVP